MEANILAPILWRWSMPLRRNEESGRRSSTRGPRSRWPPSPSSPRVCCAFCAGSLHSPYVQWGWGIPFFLGAGNAGHVQLERKAFRCLPIDHLCFHLRSSSNVAMETSWTREVPSPCRTALRAHWRRLLRGVDQPCRQSRGRCVRRNLSDRFAELDSGATPVRRSAHEITDATQFL